MINLAGRKDIANSEIVKELKEAGIPIFCSSNIRGEVPTIWYGRLNQFYFRRLWYYWSASTRDFANNETPGIPIERAKELYVDNWINEIRSGGDCACRPPETWQTEWTIQPYQKVIRLKTESDRKWFLEKPDWFEKYCVIEEADQINSVFRVDSYHIDTQTGLNHFAKFLKGLK